MRGFFCFLSIVLFACSSNKQANIQVDEKTGEEVLSLTSNKKDFQFKKVFHDALREKMVGNSQEAINLFEQAGRIKKDVPVIHYELAKLYLETDRQKAFMHAMSAATQSDDNFYYQQLYARMLQEQNDINGAIAVFEKMHALQPKDDGVTMELAAMYVYVEKYDDALAYFDSLEQRVGIMDEIVQRRKKIWLKRGNVDKAVEEVQKLIDNSPVEASYRLQKAEIFQANDREEEAMEIYKEVLAIEPNNPLVHLSLSDYYTAKKNDSLSHYHLVYAFRSPDITVDDKVKTILSEFLSKDSLIRKRGYELIDTIISVHPKAAQGHTLKGDFLYQDEKLSLAHEAFRKAVSYDASRFPIWSQLLFIDMNEKDYDQMIVDAREAKANFPNQALVYYFEGIALNEKDSLDLAIEVLNEGADLALSNTPIREEIYAMLGSVYHEKKVYDKSDASFDEALKMNPRNASVLNNYSYFLSEREDQLDKALEMSELANELVPDQPSYLDTYGWILYQKGEYKLAKDWLNKAVENGGKSSAVILEHLGDVYNKLQQKSKAVSTWKEAYSIEESVALKEKIDSVNE